jgi:hypothetical protein
MSEPYGDRAGGWSVDRFFGKYEGVVTDVADPKKIGRIRAKVPAVLGEEVDSGWALPCVPAGGGKERGMLYLPQVGDTVWIEFAAGDVSRPIWVGTFWGEPDGDPEAPTGDGKDASDTLGVLKTKSGHELTFDDDGEVVLLANGNGKSSIRFEKDGGVVIAAETIKLGASAGEKVVLGDAFMQLFNQHTHPTGVGPSGPPTPLMTGNHLSTKVTTE